LVVVVSSAQSVRKKLGQTLEEDDYGVLSLRDGGELLDFVELVAARPSRSPPLRLIVVDETVPLRTALEIAAWARLKTLEVPFVLFAAREDEKAHDLARAIGAVTVVSGANFARARLVLRDALGA
jgi:DNA-binding response OmpR family regulator